jgi:hypothetical protein
MPGNGCPRARKPLSDFAGIERPLSQHFDDFSAGWVSEGFEDSVGPGHFASFKGDSPIIS